MVNNIDKTRSRIQCEYIDQNTEMVDEFLWELNKPETVETVEALEYNGYSHFRVIDTIVFRNIHLLKECVTMKDVALWYLDDEGLLPDGIPESWINTEQILLDFEDFGYKILPNPSGGFVFIQ